MNDRKRPGPHVEVVRRVVTPSPIPKPAKAPGAPVRPTPSPSVGRSEVQPNRPPSPRGGPPRPRSPRPPPTAEQIQTLARRERVPARIAKGDLEGKMRCHIWRKLHAEEARRFDQVYTMMEKNAGLSLEDGFAALQAGINPQELLERRSRISRKDEVKRARTEVDNTAISTWFQRAASESTELAVVQTNRTALDVLTGEEPVALNFLRLGKLEKLKVVLLTRKAHWDRIGATLERDSKLSAKPSSIPRSPEKRPVADARPFLSLVGKALKLTLRNGLMFEQPLRAVGAFDLLLGDGDEQLLVPLHAIVRYQAAED